MSTKRWESKTPILCELCGQVLESVFVDGKTLLGFWAIMCEYCHEENGGRRGIGRGIVYDIKTLERIDTDIK